jgi:DNA polymerase III subunit delta'
MRATPTDAKPALASAPPCLDVVGHGQAEQTLLQAWCLQKFHHAWLLQGPRGIGKACFAWRIARFLASQSSEMPPPALDFFGVPVPVPAPSPTTLDIAQDHPLHRQILAGSVPTIKLLQRQLNDKDQLQSTIDVAQVRALNAFLNATAVDGGWRVVIVDAADELNRAAGNALLKMLEEPPPACVFLLVAHVPGRVMPTLRSRCRRLNLRPIDAQAMQDILQGLQIEQEYWPGLIKLAAGRPGRALRYHQAQALELLPTIEHALQGTLSLSERVSLITLLNIKQNQHRLEVFLELIVEAMAQQWRQKIIDASTNNPWLVQQGYQLLDEARNIASQAQTLHLEVRLLVGRLLDIAEQLAAMLKTR